MALHAISHTWTLFVNCSISASASLMSFCRASFCCFSSSTRLKLARVTAAEPRFSPARTFHVEASRQYTLRNTRSASTTASYSYFKSIIAKTRCRGPSRRGGAQSQDGDRGSGKQGALDAPRLAGSAGEPTLGLLRALPAGCVGCWTGRPVFPGNNMPRTSLFTKISGAFSSFLCR